MSETSVEQLKLERDFLLVHSQNLEAELRHLKEQSARLNELEHRLAEAGTGIDPGPHHSLRRLYRRFRETVPFLLLKPFPSVRRALRRFRS